MIIVHPDGTTTEKPFLPALMTGFVANSVIIGPEDVRQMAAMAASDPHGFQTAMVQFEYRFVEMRQPIAEIISRPVIKPYRCGACNTSDPKRYIRCNHAGCPDGRDQ